MLMKRLKTILLFLLKGEEEEVEEKPIFEIKWTG
jgi:hypothetical protein